MRHERIEKVRPSQRLRAVLTQAMLAVVLAPFLSIVMILASGTTGTTVKVAAAPAPPAGTHCGNGEGFDGTNCYIAQPPTGQCPRPDMKVKMGIGNNICIGPPISDAAQTPTISNSDFTVTDDCPKGDCIFAKYINPAVNAVSAMVGIVVTISIVTAGIRYTTSADSPQKVSEAKQRIVTSILVLVGYFVFYAFLNYLLPVKLI